MWNSVIVKISVDVCWIWPNCHVCWRRIRRCVCTNCPPRTWTKQQFPKQAPTRVSNFFCAHICIVYISPYISFIKHHNVPGTTDFEKIRRAVFYPFYDCRFCSLPYLYGYFIGCNRRHRAVICSCWYSPQSQPKCVHQCFISPLAYPHFISVCPNVKYVGIDIFNVIGPPARSVWQMATLYKFFMRTHTFRIHLPNFS